MLPIFLTQDKDLMLMQTKWASQLNPVLNNPTTNLLVLKDVDLNVGNNTINHLLGRTQQGWVIMDIDGASTIYRSQPLNDKTLTLHSSAACTVVLGVF